MKKLQVPKTTDATQPWVQAVTDNIEVITGRKGNKISRAFEAGAAPTREQFNLLVNIVNSLLDRLQD